MLNKELASQLESFEVKNTIAHHTSQCIKDIRNVSRRKVYFLMLKPGLLYTNNQSPYWQNNFTQGNLLLDSILTYKNKNITPPQQQLVLKAPYLQTSWSVRQSTRQHSEVS